MKKDIFFFFFFNQSIKRKGLTEKNCKKNKIKIKTLPRHWHHRSYHRSSWNNNEIPLPPPYKLFPKFWINSTYFSTSLSFNINTIQYLLLFLAKLISITENLALGVHRSSPQKSHNTNEISPPQVNRYLVQLQRPHP